MAINFPASPTLNQTFTVGNTNYVWDGTKWTAAVVGGIALDKIEEGNTSAEVIDTGSDGRFVVTTEGVEALRVDSSQRVGIGDSAPDMRLHVNSGTDNIIALFESTDATAYIAIKDSASTEPFGNRIGAEGNTLFLATNNGAKAITVDSSQRVLVGTSSARTVSEIVGGVTYTHQPNLQLESPNDSLGISLITNRSADSTGPHITLGKSRGNALGGVTVVQNGDELGNIYFAGADGTDIECIGAAIFAEVDGTPGANDMPGRIVLSTTAAGASSPTERMRIESGGTTQFYRDTATAGAYLIQGLSDVNGTKTTAFYFRADGGLANYSTNNVNLSDRNAKKDISLAADTWDCIKQWEIVNYRYKDQPDDADLNLGVIAQQVAESCPEVITVFQEATEDEPEKLGVKEQQMYWMAIKTLQEAQVRIEALEAEVAALKAQ